MNILSVPFHDYKVALKEGFRTRDTHVIEELSKSKRVETLVVINRPVSLIEILLRRKKLYTGGELVHKSKFLIIQKLSDHTFVIDTLDLSILRPAFLRKKFIPKLYLRNAAKIRKAVEMLVPSSRLVSYESSPLTRSLIDFINPGKKIFDGVDNFCKHPTYKGLQSWLVSEYRAILKSYDQVYFNSQDSIHYFSCQDNKKVSLLPNGLSVERFSGEKPIAEELMHFTRKKVIYAGKMQELFDVELVRGLAIRFNDVEFIFLGKILLNGLVESFEDLPNVHFLGDIHYERLPMFVCNADVCIIPYDPTKQHGGDPIKFYEYLATGLPIVSTKLGEISNFEYYKSVFIVNKELFGESLELALNVTEREVRELPDSKNWSYISHKIIGADD